MITIRTFCTWPVENKILDDDPSRELLLPTFPRRTLGEVLTLDEVNALLAQPYHLREVHDKTHPTGDKHKPKDDKKSKDDAKPDDDEP